MGLLFVFVFLSLNALLVVFPHTPAAIVQLSSSNEEIFYHFYPKNNFDDSKFHPRCDSEKPFPQMLRLPYLQNSWQIVYSCEQNSSDNVSKALMAFYVRWVKEFGDPDGKILESFDSMLVEWGPKKRTINLIYSIKGVLLKNADVVGLATGPKNMWCYFPKDSKISRSSFTHELVHLALWAQGGTPDPDHEGDSYPGWTPAHTTFIHEFNAVLEKSGL